MIGQQVTIRALASKAGVSPSTVSLALRNDLRAAAATRERIQALARKMGYRRDPVVARMMAQLPKSRREHSPVLAFVTDHPVPFAKLAPTMDTSSLAGAHRRALEQGYDLHEFRMTEQTPAPRLARMLLSRGIEGILAGPMQRANTRLGTDWQRFSAVAIGESLDQPRLDRVTNNQFKSIMTAMRRLYEIGYRRVGLIIGTDSEQRVNHRWGGGYLMACDLLGLSPLPRWMPDQPATTGLAAWVRRCRPDMLLLSSLDVLSPAQQAWIASRGHYASLHLHAGEQQVSGIQQHWARLGAAAVDLLIRRIHKGQTGAPDFPMTIQGDGEWVPGKTAPGRKR